MSKLPTRTRLSERRRHAANFACIFAFACSFAFNGWTQGAFSRHLGIPHATISSDLAAMLECWRESSVCDFENVRLEVLPRIDLITLVAQSDDFVAHSGGVVAHRGDIGAPKGPLCATPEFRAEFDASQNRIEACDNFRGIFPSRYLLSEASICATQVLVRQEETARGTGDRRARAARKFMHKSAMKEC